MPAAYFLTYIVLFGGVTRLVLDQRPPSWVVFLLVVAFFIGWFIVIGLAKAHDEGRHKSGTLLSSGVKDGLGLLKGWVSYMVGLALVSGVIFLLFEYPHT